ncbi:hypothetical protein SPSIL_039630 [Sporomusa silvacetica DSM 10669]|uniref:Uncharacterized protein n=1 Tax=Sporomusa silvacetica DSM 10669 TaxID=1123289 RepID=A0ABZ3IQ28_9FIRM|nr:EVE domain-containing protein [Sporomusa silvacetica]OZC16268.1 hypothetical protein SPSIL_38310 [Sporomusa silvacetica DSM 10669]
MANWLTKTEPESFSYADLQHLGRDRWNGVKIFTAVYCKMKMDKVAK